MAKDNMPDFKNSPRPKLLDAKKLAEDAGLEPPPFQVWRYGDFMVIFVAESPGCMAVDLEGEIFIQRAGKPEVMFAIIDALYGVKFKGERLYPTTPRNISDREFFDQSMASLGAYMPVRDDTPDVETLDEIYRAAREDFLNELIKPPKKD